MKILYNIAGTCHSGGMERVLANKANYLVAHGYEVVVATTDQRGELPFFPLDSRIRCFDLGINYDDNNGKSIWNKVLHFPFKQHRHKKRLEALIKTERPDITVSMFCNDVNFISRINDGSAKILEIHFSKFKRLQYNRKGLWRLADTWRSWEDERVVRQFDKFVVLTEEDKSYWGELPNITVIPNANTFKPTLPHTTDKKKVVAIGRHSHQKGFDRLVEAWRVVTQRFPDWKLEIVGSLDDSKPLQTLIASYGLGNSILLTAPVKNVAEIYREASILALSSRYEGFPLVLIEAQSFGIPLVSFGCKCGPKDIIEHGKNGLLVKEGNIQGLAEALMLLMGDDQLRMSMSRNALEMSKRYDEEVIMAQWMTLFDETLSCR